MRGESWYEVAFGPLYPLLYQHRDRDEAERAVAHFASLLRGRTPVLDLACGTGRYLDALDRSSLAAFGLDLSPALLEIAAQTHRGRIARADMRHVPVRDGSVGGVISMFTSFGYFESDAENAAVLSEVGRVLRPGGAFVLDFFNAALALDNPPADTRREAEGFVIVEKRRVSRDRRFLVKHVRADSVESSEMVEYEERVRAYLPDELETMVSAAGLQVAQRYGDYAGAGFDAGASDRFVLVCASPQRGSR